MTWQEWRDRNPMRPWHMRKHTSRAFIRPGGFWRRVHLYLRGWRPHWIGPLWQKAGKLSDKKVDGIHISHLSKYRCTKCGF